MDTPFGLTDFKRQIKPEPVGAPSQSGSGVSIWNGGVNGLLHSLPHLEWAREQRVEINEEHGWDY